MRVFYLLLFCAVGLFCVAAAVFNLQRFISYFAKGRKSTFYRVLIGAAGMLLIAYGIAYFARLI